MQLQIPFLIDRSDLLKYKAIKNNKLYILLGVEDVDLSIGLNFYRVRRIILYTMVN
jgi:hypothetical protein